MKFTKVELFIGLLLLITLSLSITNLYNELVSETYKMEVSK